MTQRNRPGVRKQASVLFGSIYLLFQISDLNEPFLYSTIHLKSIYRKYVFIELPVSDCSEIHIIEELPGAHFQYLIEALHTIMKSLIPYPTQLHHILIIPSPSRLLLVSVLIGILLAVYSRKSLLDALLLPFPYPLSFNTMGSFIDTQRSWSLLKI
jgi:hypothetical protein